MQHFRPCPTLGLLSSVMLTSMLVGGCANWKDDPGVSRGLPTIRENPKSVILNVQFSPIRIEADDADDEASLWQWVDETSIDIGTRQKWMVNGLRIGRLINEERFRSRLRHMAPTQDVVDKFLHGASVASEVSHGGKRIPLRLGRRYELPLRQPIAGSHVALLRLGENTIGRSLVDPQYLLALTATPGKSAGLVNVALRPEIHHGETKQEWISSDSALRIDTRRETWSIAQLDVEFTGTKGDTFVIAGGHPSTGLARQMLAGESADHSPLEVVVLIRVEQIPDASDEP